MDIDLRGTGLNNLYVKGSRRMFLSELAGQSFVTVFCGEGDVSLALNSAKWKGEIGSMPARFQYCEVTPVTVSSEINEVLPGCTTHQACIDYPF